MKHSSTLGGWLGLLWDVLLFVSAGMVSLPGSSAPPGAIAAFYAEHRSIILVAQAIGLLAVPVFVVFSALLERFTSAPPDGRRGSGITVAGGAVGLAAVATSVPVIALTLSTAGLSRWVQLTDLTDAVLFLTLAWFCATLTMSQTRLPLWLRLGAAAVGLMALARSVTGFSGHTTVLDTVSPLAILAFVLAVSVWLLLARRAVAESQGEAVAAGR